MAFWQVAPGGGGDVDCGVATPKQVCAPFGLWCLHEANIRLQVCYSSQLE
jgi:hypothetical protein